MKEPGKFLAIFAGIIVLGMIWNYSKKPTEDIVPGQYSNTQELLIDRAYVLKAEQDTNGLQHMGAYEVLPASGQTVTVDVDGYNNVWVKYPDGHEDEVGRLVAIHVSSDGSGSVEYRLHKASDNDDQGMPE
jgi:hypothetical protein